MTTKFKILTTISFIALAIALTFVGVWALTDLDFTVGGNIEYTAPASEVKDVSEYPTLQFYVTNATEKTVSVQANRSNLPTGELVIPSKVLSDGEEYTITSIEYVSSGTLLKSTSQNFDKEIQLPEMSVPPPSIETIYYAFNECVGLTSVKIPNTVTNLEDYAFSGCTGLTSITIPASVASIVSTTFNQCSGLETIIVESGNTVYNSNNNCNAIIETSTNTLITGCKNTVIPSSVTSIGSWAFNNTGLTSITIPGSVTSIGASAFYGCTGLTSVTIGSGVTSIGGAAFASCISLTSITIPDKVTSIGDHAFRQCTSLTTITIPDSVTSIGSEAFYGCTRLTSVTIGSGVTSIGASAFYGCTRLTSVTIGSGVTSIGMNTFYNCTSLEKVEVKATTVPTGGYNMFYNCPLTTGILVPSGSMTNYQSATYWKNYVDYIKAGSF